MKNIELPMTEEDQILFDYENEIRIRRDELLMLKKETFELVRSSSHGSKNTKTQIKIVETAESRIDTTLHSIVEFSSVAENLNAAEKIYEKCRDLYGFTRDMNDTLSRDLAEQYRKETSSITGKIVSFATILGVCVTAVKAGVGEGVITVSQAVIIGGAIGGVSMFHKDIKTLFGHAKKVTFPPFIDRSWVEPLVK